MSKACSRVLFSYIFPKKNIDFILADIIEVKHYDLKLCLLTNINLLFPFLNIIFSYLIKLGVVM